MRECICGQCAETEYDFKGWIQCHHCELYGHPEDSFDMDPNHEVCNECMPKYNEDGDDR